jgi:hypothetical protein
LEWHKVFYAGLLLTGPLEYQKICKAAAFLAFHNPSFSSSQIKKLKYRAMVKKDKSVLSNKTH